MFRWQGRTVAVALILSGLWFLSQPQYASTETSVAEVRGWVLLVLGVVYFVAEYRLKAKADQRADRAEAREIELHRRRMDDRD
ncbi:hypothetical protein GCM10023264_17570 [Sphingomonas daechungensis]|uniref:Uncharacterized protein n=1 Tax=Sphingomonas daechungensis TaxID=1176646 RepID=A0ABX6T2F5_9SPHN|nr:hypothetical protein [Sphingomonas daechungensis]QNP44047.1 hypothetical protein H9L15_05605 [Sphingomonas daechungensis]